MMPENTDWRESSLKCSLRILRLRLGSLSFLLVPCHEVFAFDSEFRFFFILFCPGTETVTVPRHAWLERGKTQFFPDGPRPIHEFLARQRHRGVGPWPHCVDQ